VKHLNSLLIKQLKFGKAKGVNNLFTIQLLAKSFSGFVCLNSNGG